MKLTSISSGDDREVELGQLPKGSALKHVVLPDLGQVDDDELRRAHAHVFREVFLSNGIDRMVIGVGVLKPLEEEMKRRGMQADYWSMEHKLESDRQTKERSRREAAALAKACEAKELQERLQREEMARAREREAAESRERLRREEAEREAEELRERLRREEMARAEERKAEALRRRTDVEDLANYLWSEPNRAWREALLLGIGSERRRLAQKPFVIAVTRSEFDHGGLQIYEFLETSHETAEEAEQAAQVLFEEMRKSETTEARPDYFGRSAIWSFVEEKVSPYEPAKPRVEGPSEISRRTFKVSASDFESKYFTITVLGPFDGEPVDKPLIDLLGHSLAYYLIKLGEAMRRGKRRPRAGDDL